MTSRIRSRAARTSARVSEVSCTGTESIPGILSRVTARADDGRVFSARATCSGPRRNETAKDAKKNSFLGALGVLGGSILLSLPGQQGLRHFAGAGVDELRVGDFFVGSRAQ